MNEVSGANSGPESIVLYCSKCNLKSNIFLILNLDSDKFLVKSLREDLACFPLALGGFFSQGKPLQELHLNLFPDLPYFSQAVRFSIQPNCSFKHFHL